MNYFREMDVYIYGMKITSLIQFIYLECDGTLVSIIVGIFNFSEADEIVSLAQKNGQGIYYLAHSI